MPDWESVTFVVPPEMKQKLNDVARERLTTTSAVLRELLLKHLETVTDASVAPATATKEDGQ